jgi:hypothetical protein
MRKGNIRRVFGNKISVRPEDLNNLLRPLSQKKGHRANTWVPIIMNVPEETSGPAPSFTPTQTITQTPTFTPTNTPTLTPTITLTPTPSQITFYILAETGDILQAENNDLIEYEH